MGPFFSLGDRAGRPGLGGPAALAGAGAVRRVPRRRAAGRARSASGPTSPHRSPGFAFALSPRMLTAARPDLDRGLAERAGARGCCCRSCRRLERGSPRRAAALVGPGGRDGAAASTRPPTFAVLPLGRALAADPQPRPAAPRADAVVAGVHAARHAVVAGPAASCWAPTARRSSTTSRPPPITTFPTTLVRRAAGHLELGAVRRRRLRGPGNDLMTAVLPGPQQRRRCCCSGSSGCSHCGATRTGSSSLSACSSGLRAGDGGPRAAPCRAGSPAELRHAARRCRSRRCATCTSSTRSSGCRWSLGLAWSVDAAASPLEAPRRRTPSSPALGVAERANAALADRRRSWSRWSARRIPALRRPDRARPGLRASVPGYWQRGGRLARTTRTRPGTALLVPGSSFGIYVWGAPRDEPLQSLAGSAVGGAQRDPAHPGRQHPDARRDRAAARPGPRVGRARGVPAPRRGRPPGGPQRPRARPTTCPTRSWSTRRWPTRPGWSGSPTLRAGRRWRAAHRGRPTGQALINGGWQTEYPAVEVFA